MFNLFFRFPIKRVKKSSSPFMEYRIIIKEGMWEKIRILKGWKTDADAARALNLTRSYISMLTKAKVGCTATFITRLSAALGSTAGNWWAVFRMIPRGDFSPNHPFFNQQKHNGEVPYDRFSIASITRNHDYLVEKNGDERIASA